VKIVYVVVSDHEEYVLYVKTLFFAAAIEHELKWLVAISHN